MRLTFVALTLLFVAFVAGCSHSRRAKEPVVGTIAEPVPSPVSVSPASVPVPMDELIVAPPDTPSKPKAPVKPVAQKRFERENEYSYDSYMPPRGHGSGWPRSMRGIIGW